MSTIKCRTCKTAMIVDRCETSALARTCWHQCPLCKQVRLTSERESSVPETSMVEDDNPYVAETDYSLA